jgi:hypothetical protein
MTADLLRLFFFFVLTSAMCVNVAYDGLSAGFDIDATHGPLFSASAITRVDEMDHRSRSDLNVPEMYGQGFWIHRTGSSGMSLHIRVAQSNQRLAKNCISGINGTEALV